MKQKMKQKPSITSLLIVNHAPNLENFYLTIGDILQIPLILTHAQTKSDYTLKKVLTL